jgi:PAS domain S-box-containing protein
MNTLDHVTSAMILDNIPILLFVKDTNNKITKVNKTFANTFGKSKKELQGKSVYDLFPKELADKYFEDDNKVITTKKPITRIIEIFQTADGTQRWYRTDKFPYYNDKKEVIGIVGYAIDIHDSILEKDELKKLTTAIEYSPSIVVITDVDGKITYTNPQFTKVTGYTKKEAQNVNANFLRSGKVANETYVEMWETIKNKNIWHGEFINKTKDGELYWEIASIAPVLNDKGKIISYIKVASALTDLKRTAFNIWNVFEESSNYILILDKNMRIVYCNKTLAKLLGYKNINDLIGNFWYTYLTEESKDSVQLVHNEVLKGSAHVGEFINEIKSKDSDIYLIKWFNSLINGDSHLTFSVGLQLKQELDLNDSVDNIRRYFKSTIDRDRQFIMTMRQKIKDEKEK